jgi:hypothetical protein
MNRREFVKLGAGALAATTGWIGRPRGAPGQESRPARPDVRFGAGGLITGSFLHIRSVNVWDMAYSDDCLFWKEANWLALLHDMHDLGMDTAIWTQTAYWGRPMFPGYDKKVGLPYRLGCADPMGAVAAEADRLGMKLFYGVGLRGRCSQVRDYAGMDKPWPDVWFRWNTALAEALAERYGNRPSFGGLYISYEIDYHDLHVELYEKLTREYLRPAVGNVKILASPGNLGVEVRDLDKFPAMVERSGIDILAPQDYGGRTQNVGQALELVRKNVRALEKVGKRLRDIGVSLWSNCETFVLDGTPDGRCVCMPGPIERIRQQVEMQSPLAEKLVCFTYQGVMNRHTDLVDIGHPSTAKLYAQYAQHLRERFPGRFQTR